MLILIPSYCSGFETNNTDYDMIGVITSGNDNISNSDYNTNINIGQQIIGTTNNNDYDISIGFFYSVLVEPYPVIGEEIFDDNVYADNYETANITLSLDPTYTESYTFEYTIPYDINDVNTSSIQVQNMSGDNISYTLTNSVITVITSGTQDPYYITYDVKAVKKMTRAEYGDCPIGWQEYVNHCLLMTSSTSGVNYKYRYFMNVSRNETNQSNIIHNQSTDILINFGSRNTLTVSVNGSSANTSNTVIGNILQFNISDTHDSDTSLFEGKYYIEVIYDVFASDIPPSSGGGSTTPTTICGDGICDWNENSDNCLIDCPLPLMNDFILPTTLNYSFISGVVHKEEITARNNGNEIIELVLETVCTSGYEHLCDMNWFDINGERSSNIFIEIQPHENTTFTLYTIAPLTMTQKDYEFNIKATRIDDNTDEYSPLVKWIHIEHTVQVSSVPEQIVKYVANVLGYEIFGNFTKDIPFTEKDNLVVSDLILIIIVIFVILYFVIKRFK